MLIRLLLKLFPLIPSGALFLGRKGREALRDMLADYRPSEASEALSVTVASVDDVEDMEEKLSEHGVVVVPGAIAHHELQRSLELLQDVAVSIRDAPEGEATTIDGSLDVVFGDQDYATMRDRKGALAVVRSGADAGMIDIFHADRYLASRGEDLIHSIESAGVGRAVESVLPDGFKLKNVNAYLNWGVTRTRGFHVDSYGGNQLKAFVYLTDVLSLQDGPYCYVIGSHSDGRFPLVNIGLAKFLGRKRTDVSALDPSNAVPFLGESGTLIVSNQSGAHRGYPQTKDGRRVLLALNFQAG